MSGAPALAALGAPAADRAHHVQRSARQGDSAAVATLREAGEAAAQRAPASAAVWFGDALRLLPRPLLPRCGSSFYSPTRGCWPRPGSLPRATPLCSRASGWSRPRRSHYECGSRRRAPASSTCSAATRTLTRLVSAMESLRDPASPEAAALMMELAMDGFFLMEYELCARGPSSPRGPRLLDDRPLTAAAVALLAFASAASGATADAETHSTEAAVLVADLADDSPFASTPPPTSPAPSSTSTATRTREPTRSEAMAVAWPPGRANSSRSRTQLSVRSSCCADSWRKQVRCSTTPSRARDCRATSRPSRETWSSALSRRSPRVTSTRRSAPRRRTSS